MRDDAYSVLGVSLHASDADVRSAYRRQALTTHPDKGGTAEAFRKVVQAFEILGDVRRRAAYERAVFGPEKRDSPSRRAARTSGPRVPSEVAQGGSTKRRRQEGGAARKSCPPRAEPQVHEKKDRMDAACPNWCSRAAQETEESERHRPACSKRRPPTETGAGNPRKCQTGKPSSVTRLIEELFKLMASALTKRLNELSDATLAEIEAFLRDNIGGDHEQTEWERNEAATEENDVGRGGGDDGIMDDESCPSEEAAATLALTWGVEEDVMSGASGSDSELIPCDADFDSGPHLPADGVQEADAIATTRPVAVENSDAATMGLCDEGAATLAAAGNGVAKHGDVVDDGTTEVSSPLPPQQSARGQSMFRGVSKSHGKFMVSVGVEGIEFHSSLCSDLATAIDIHIFLVRMRQILIARIQEDIDFPDALREVDGLVMAERQCQPFDWRLSYLIKRRVKVGDTWRKETKQTRNIDEAIALWEKMYGSHFQKRVAKRRHVFAKHQERLERLRRLARVRSEKIEKKQAEKEKKRRRFEKRQMALQQRIERKRQAQARKRQAQARKWQAQARKRQAQQQRQERKRRRQERVEARLLRRKRFLLAHTQRVLGNRRRRQQRVLLGRWGVRKLPVGVEAASLHQANDSVCCVLRLSDGSMRQGPPRLSLKEAETDVIELSALQSRRGDVAACIELERRDVDAMTAHFLQVI